MATLVYGNGRCVSISRFHELYTILFQEPWGKQTGKLKKLLNSDYKGIAIRCTDLYVYYTYTNTIKKSEDVQIKKLLKWGEQIQYEDLKALYFIVYGIEMTMTSDQVSKLLPLIKSKYFSGPLLMTFKIPTEEELAIEITKILPNNFELDEDLYDEPKKRKTSESESTITNKIRKITCSYKERPLEYTMSIMDTIGTYL